MASALVQATGRLVPVARLISAVSHRQCSSRPQVVARTLGEAFSLRSSAVALALVASEDLLCRNIMCEKVGRPCICRLAQSMERMSKLEEIDLSDNGLEALPDAVFGIPVASQAANTNSAASAAAFSPRRVILRNNKLKTLSASLALSPAAASLEHLDLSRNAFSSFKEGFAPWLGRLTGLKELVLTGNPVAKLEEELVLIKKSLASPTTRLIIE